MARAKATEKRKSGTHSATVAITVAGETKHFELRNVDFDQKRDEASLNIGRTIIDHVYNSTEGKRASK